MPEKSDINETVYLSKEEIRERKRQKDDSKKTFGGWLEEKQVKPGDFIKIYSDIIVKVENIDFDRKLISFKDIETGNTRSYDFSKFDSTLKGERGGVFDSCPELSSESEAMQKIENQILQTGEKIKELQEKLAREQDNLSKLKLMKESEFTPEKENK